MSVFGLERSQTSATNLYDHAINLVDSTKPRDEVEGYLDDPSGSAPISRITTASLLSGQGTGGQLRKELARRKYAKWQEVKQENGEGTTGPGDEDVTRAQADARQANPPRKDTWGRGRLQDRVPFRAKKKTTEHNENLDTFIDVLYENQRGFFFCGIPLYSAKSLLNYDPSGWQTSTFQDSAVNITNAQLPDPSWAWAWRTWYVDMSHDVDEEGWEYSFTFQNGFAWHGSHPWFHSFVRRRRWLRKRVRTTPHHAHGRKGDMKEAHMLTADYFTIHSANRDRSRGSSADRNAANRPSYRSSYQAGDDDNGEEFGEIADISALMAALRHARVDREKVAAIRQFFEQGGDELFYLADNIPAIMEDFIHQTSRRQLQAYLLQVLDAATQSQEDEEADSDKRDARRRRIDNLLKAVHAAGVHVNDIAYWSDLRARATSSEEDPTNETHALDATQVARVPGEEGHAHSDDDEASVKEDIKGIPDEAEIAEEPQIQFNTSKDDDVHHRAGDLLDQGKGKGKA